MKQSNYPLYKASDYKSFNHMFCSLTEKHPGREAFIYKQNKEIIKVSYDMLLKDIAFMIKGFEKHNLSGKHIACMGRNSYQYALTFISSLCYDTVFVPVDKDLTEDAMVNLINHSESCYLFLDNYYEEKILKNLDKMPKLEKIIFFDRPKNTNGTLLEDFGEYTDDYKNYVKENEKDVNSLASIIYTSGTTGQPKGVMLSRKNILSCAYGGVRVCPVKTRCLSVLPYHHTYEETCGIIVSLWCGATICINSGLTKVLAELNFYKPDYMVIVPAFAELFYKNIMKNIKAKGKEKLIEKAIIISQKLLKIGIDIRPVLFKEIHQAFGGNLKKIYCGGAPINPETCRFFEKIGIMFICGYGITECSPFVAGNRDLFNDHATVGVCSPSAEIEIRDKTEEGIGEICVKGAIVMQGYYKNQEETKRVIKNGWFYTGDFGFTDKNDRLVISGRKKNIIVLSNGKNIYPEELEEKLKEIPEINEIVVRESKDENGYTIGLFGEIYLGEEVNISKDALYEKVKECLKDYPSYKKLNHIVLRDTPFDKTTTKKIKR